jgi:hypothetical protein
MLIMPRLIPATYVRRFAFMGPMCSGKSQPLDEPVLTLDGFKPIGTLNVDDYIVGNDGKATQVLGVFPQLDQPTYKVTLSDGRTTRASADHLWLTQTWDERHRKEPCWTIKTTKQILESLSLGYSKGHHWIPLPNAIEFPAKIQNINPYLMGLLLGDGGFTADSVVFTNISPTIIGAFKESLPKEDTVYQCGISFGIKRVKRNNKPSVTKQALIDYGLNGLCSCEKFIPEHYLMGDIDQRLDLLRGLVDTDGHIFNGYGIEYCTVSSKLAEHVIFLVRSLGGTAKLVKKKFPTYMYLEKKKIGKPAYRVFIRFPKGGVIPTKGKVADWIGTPSRHGLRIINIEYVGIKPSVCIKVAAPEELYVTNNFIVTHNTFCANQLTINNGFHKLGFTDKLKSLAYDLYGVDGKDGDARRILQELSDDLKKYDKDLFIKHLLYHAKKYEDGSIVVDDLRFRTEANALRLNGFKIVMVTCNDDIRRERIARLYPSAPLTDQGHRSEQEWASIPFDYSIVSEDINTIFDLPKILGLI